MFLSRSTLILTGLAACATPPDTRLAQTEAEGDPVASTSTRDGFAILPMTVGDHSILQEPQAQDPEDALPPLSRWSTLLGPMHGERDALQVALHHESVEFDLDNGSRARVEASGIRAAWCAQDWGVEGGFYLPSVQVDEQEASDASGSHLLLGGFTLGLGQAAGLALQSRLSVGVGQSDVALFDSSTTSPASTDLRWFQADATLGATYSPSAEASFALSPSAGLGFRYVDGFHEFPDQRTVEFDAPLPYAFVGLHWMQCIGDSSRWTLESTAMVGELQGFQASLSLFF